MNLREVTDEDGYMSLSWGQTLCGDLNELSEVRESVNNWCMVANSAPGDYRTFRTWRVAAMSLEAD